MCFNLEMVLILSASHCETDQWNHRKGYLVARKPCFLELDKQAV